MQRLKFFIAGLAIFTINIHAVFTGAMLVRNKKTGGFVTLVSDIHTHVDISKGQRVTLNQRKEFMDRITAEKATGKNIFVGVEDARERYRQNSEVCEKYPLKQEMYSKVVANSNAPQKVLKEFAVGCSISPLDFLVTECRLKNIPCGNSEKRELAMSWDRLSYSSSPPQWENIEPLKVVVRARCIAKVRDFCPVKVQAQLIDRIYTWSAMDVSNGDKMRELIDSTVYEVDIEFLAQCKQQETCDHIYLLGGALHTETVHKLLLESGQYESVATFGTPICHINDEIAAIEKIDYDQLLAIPALNVKKTFAEIQNKIKANKKILAPAIRAKL